MIEGKLYKCSNYYLMIYPTEEKARAAAATGPAPAARGMAIATLGPPGAAASMAATRVATEARTNYWSKELNCSVRFVEPNEMFMCLNEPKDEFAHVLFGEKQGWIIVKNWLKIEEIK